MDAFSLLTADRITFLDTPSKTEALLTLIEIVNNNCPNLDKEDFTKQIFYREQLMSTGLGGGLAVPHVRYEGITEPLIAIGIAKRGIPDYESLDNQPIQVVVMIAVGKEEHKTYLRILSQIATHLKAEGVLQAIASADNTEAVLTLISQEAAPPTSERLAERSPVQSTRRPRK